MSKYKLKKWVRKVMIAPGIVLLLSPAFGAQKKGPGKGIASYYADKFNGRTTASGEVFSNNKLTAAHNSLPLGTLVKVTNLHNGRTVVVRITDRLHRANTRIIDLTRKAASKLGFVARGLTKVKVEVVSPQLPKVRDNDDMAAMDFTRPLF